MALAALKNLTRKGFFKNIKQAIARKMGEMELTPIPDVDERLAELESVFLAPPLTPELVSAIRLISPHCAFNTKEKYRAVWEADQNAHCWGEYEALAPLFHSMPRPTRILEIGPGLGRSLVFFTKKLGWQDCEIHAYEGEGKATKYTVLGPRFKDSFCGNISMLRRVLLYNGVNNITIFDAEKTQLGDLPGPYDFVYSFFSVGYHWGVEHFLDDLDRLLHEKSFAVFTLPLEFTVFQELRNWHYKILKWKTGAKNEYLKLLVLSKNTLADFFGPSSRNGQSGP
jgi:hypothetical protein